MRSTTRTRYIDTGIKSRIDDEVISSAQAAQILGVSLSRFYKLSELPEPVGSTRFYRHDIVWIREYSRQLHLGRSEDEARAAAALAVQPPSPSPVSTTPPALEAPMAKRGRGRPRKTLAVREGGAA